MPSISELRNRLAKAQAKAPTARLSKSQCIDILLKVCQKRNITLIPTINGDELLTLKQLEADVVDVITVRGGRVTLAELAATIGVQRNHVDRMVDAMLTEQPDKYTNLQDSIITKDYMNKLMILANSRLQECGLLNLCDFATEFELPFDMLKALVIKTEVIHGKLNGNVLESQAYETCKERCIMAALAATTVPTSTVQVATLVKIDVNLVNNVITDLVKTNKVNGSIKSGVYTPKKYTEHRNSALVTFYNANSYIEKQKIMDSTKNTEEDLTKIFKDAITLETVIIHKKLIEPVSVLVREAIAHATWSNLAIMLPTAITPPDLCKIIGGINGANKNGYCVEGLYVSNKFEETFLKHVVNILKEQTDPHELLQALTDDNSDLYDMINNLMYEEPDSIFAELWAIASQEFYERAQSALVVLVRKVCKMRNEIGSKRAIDVTEATQELKNLYMKAIHTCKGVEKICNGTVDESHLIMKTMVKELLPADCHLLLSVYARQNHIEISGDRGDINANNRNAVIDDIKDIEVKAIFKTYVEALKLKDAIKCMKASKALRAAMYISCNVKNEKKTFIKAQTVHYKQQLAALTTADVLRVVYCTLNLALLKHGNYVFLVDKQWCLNGCMDSLEPLVKDTELMGNMRKALLNKDVKALEKCQKLML